MSHHQWLLAALVLALGSVTAKAADPAPLKFKDVMQDLNLADPGFGWYSYHDNIAVGDWDNDGDLDLVISVSPSEKGPKGSQGRLFVNLLKETGKLGFEDRTEKLMAGGIQKEIIADGNPFFFDVNNDGWLDLCSISDEHKPVTFLNQAGQKFEMKKSGFNAQSCALKDLNGDGFIDVIGSDTGYIYMNDGKGGFTEQKPAQALSGHMPRTSILPTPPGFTVDDEVKTKAATPKTHVYFFWKPMDFNGDGQEDMMLTVSQVYAWAINRFYVKTANGYEDVTKTCGLPAEGHMTFMDVNGDGLQDCVVSDKYAGIYLGDGKGHFTAAPASDANKVLAIELGGCTTAPQYCVDLNNDGILDLVLYEYRAGSGSRVLQGLGGGRFKEVLTTNAGSGQVVADFNGDGLLDIISSEPKRGLHVYLNQSTPTGHWLELTAKGPAKNTFAVNAVAEVFPAGKMGQNGARLGQATFGSANMPLHFGLGAVDKVDVRVTYNGKVAQELKDIAVDKLMAVTVPE